MNLIIKLWRRLKKFLGVKTNKSTSEIYQEAIAITKVVINRDEILLKAGNTSDDNERKKILKTITEFEKAKKIIQIIEQDRKLLSAPKEKKKRKRLFEICELAKELSHLEEKLTLLDYTKSQINTANYPDTSSLDKGIDRMYTQLAKNKIDDKVTIIDKLDFKFEKSFLELEKLININSSLQKHKTREEIKLKQEEIYRNQIKRKLSTLENLLNQNKLIEVRSLIDLLTDSIKPIYKTELASLTVLKGKFKEKELQVFKKRQEDLLKKQAEQVQFLKEIQDKRQKELKFKIEQELLQKKEGEEKLNEKDKRLKSLLSRRVNWRDFQKVLQENNINTFYHFTDYQNIKSIKKNKGLYSWYYADANGIVINSPGGDTLSRELDRRYGLQDYVRVSFCNDHPMQYRLEKRGLDLALLKVDIEVAYYESTIFCDINATDTNHLKGNQLQDLERIRFLATQRNFVKREDPDFKYHQAEVLLKTWIPIEHITNIDAIY